MLEKSLKPTTNERVLFRVQDCVWITFSAEIKIRCHLLHQPWTEARTCPIFPALLGCSDAPPQLQNKIKQKSFPPTSTYREHEHVFWAFSAETISSFVKRGDSQHVWCPMNRTNTSVMGCIQPRMWHLLVTETASESLHVRPLLPPLPEQVRLWKHFQTPARSAWNKVFTESGWLLVGSELPACSAVQERVDKLTVVLAEAGLIADVVEFTCKVR